MRFFQWVKLHGCFQTITQPNGYEIMEQCRMVGGVKYTLIWGVTPNLLELNDLSFICNVRFV